jgi:hypothetical protein
MAGFAGVLELAQREGTWSRWLVISELLAYYSCSTATYLLHALSAGAALSEWGFKALKQMVRIAAHWRVCLIMSDVRGLTLTLHEFHCDCKSDKLTACFGIQLQVKLSFKTGDLPGMLARYRQLLDKVRGEAGLRVHVTFAANLTTSLGLF